MGTKLSGVRRLLGGSSEAGPLVFATWIDVMVGRPVQIVARAVNVRRRVVPEPDARMVLVERPLRVEAPLEERPGFVTEDGAFHGVS